MFAAYSFIVGVQFECFAPELHGFGWVAAHKVYVAGVIVDFGGNGVLSLLRILVGYGFFSVFIA